MRSINILESNKMPFSEDRCLELFNHFLSHQRERKLVDEIGGLRQALAEARRLAKLPEYAPIQELPVIESSLVGRLLGLEDVRSQSATPVLPKEVHELARALAPFAIHASDKPLALLELVPVFE